MARLLGFAVLVFLLTACSWGTGNGEQSSGEGPGSGTAHRGTTDAPERATEGAAAPTVPVAWDYVALGDSLAAGVGARRGYVDRYAEHLRDDAGTRVRLVNLGVSGQTSPQLLRVLRNDPSTRRAIGGAEVITFNIGINDLGQASRSYEAGTCGGTRNERCLRMAVGTLERNWDTITEEVLSLRPGGEAIIRTAGLGYTPQADGLFGSYLGEVNRHIAASAAEDGIPYAEVRLADEGIGPDGLHPNDQGYATIAERLRRLGYGLLGPR